MRTQHEVARKQNGAPRNKLTKKDQKVAKKTYMSNNFFYCNRENWATLEKNTRLKKLILTKNLIWKTKLYRKYSNTIRLNNKQDI